MSTQGTYIDAPRGLMIAIGAATFSTIAASLMLTASSGESHFDWGALKGNLLSLLLLLWSIKLFLDDYYFFSIDEGDSIRMAGAIVLTMLNFGLIAAAFNLGFYPSYALSQFVLTGIFFVILGGWACFSFLRKNEADAKEMRNFLIWPPRKVFNIDLTDDGMKKALRRLQAWSCLVSIGLLVWAYCDEMVYFIPLLLLILMFVWDCICSQTFRFRPRINGGGQEFDAPTSATQSAFLVGANTYLVPIPTEQFEHLAPQPGEDFEWDSGGRKDKPDSHWIKLKLKRSNQTGAKAKKQIADNQPPVIKG